MQKILTAQEMREVDYDAVIKLRITEKQLMELAGKESCNILLRRYAGSERSFTGKKFLIVCGKGNNGGDGIVLARHLLNHSATVDLIYLAPTSLLKQDGAATLKILTQYIAYTNRLRVFESDEMITDSIVTTHYDFIIDAILGTGYKRTDSPQGIKRRDGNNPFLPLIAEEKLSEPDKANYELAAELKPTLSPIIREAILLINQKRKTQNTRVISLDIPSGIDGTTGEGSTENGITTFVQADLTIALGFLKTGFFGNAGITACGEIEVADISIPDFLTRPHHAGLIDAAFVQSKRPRRAADSAKHINGKVLLIAGSQTETASMMGAAMLSIRAAIAMGAGYVAAAVPASAFNTIHIAAPEAVLISQDEAAIQEKIAWADSVVIGCGFGRTPQRIALLAKLLTSSALREKKLVIDADALYAIAELGLLPQLHLSQAVLTPHIGEFSRLLGLSTTDITADKLYYAKAFAEKFKLGLLLKGSPTVICANAKTYFNTNGTAALATAGTGDILSGMIGSLAAQGLLVDEAAACAAFLHAEAGVRAATPTGINNAAPSATDVLRGLT
jgi:ADP-dependent NAD(P)H-hydrate dehydratase / NAD(P)H-hydrate epimerase